MKIRLTQHNISIFFVLSENVLYNSYYATNMNDEMIVSMKICQFFNHRQNGTFGQNMMAVWQT